MERNRKQSREGKESWGMEIGTKESYFALPPILLPSCCWLLGSGSWGELVEGPSSESLHFISL